MPVKQKLMRVARKAAVVCLEVFHVCVSLWISLGWALVAGQTLLLAHATTCAATVASWKLTGSCPITRATNAVAGRPEHDTFFPRALEHERFVYSATLACMSASVGRLVRA